MTETSHGPVKARRPAGPADGPADPCPTRGQKDDDCAALPMAEEGRFWNPARLPARSRAAGGPT